MWQDIELAYRGEELAPLPFSYSDHTTWQANRRASSNDDHWVTSVGDVPRMQLHRPSTPDPDGLRERVGEITATELRAATGTSPFATVLAALATVLRRYCDADEVTLGALVSTRDHPSAEQLVGYHLNTLPLTFDLDPDRQLADLRARCAETLAAGLAHRTVPFADIVSARRRAGLPDPTPQVLVALQELDDVSFASHHGTQEILFTGTAVADATFFVQQRGGRVVLAVEHRGSEVSAEVADQLLADLDTALTALVRRPDSQVGTVTFDSQQRLASRRPDASRSPTRRRRHHPLHDRTARRRRGALRRPLADVGRARPCVDRARSAAGGSRGSTAGPCRRRPAQVGRGHRRHRRDAARRRGLRSVGPDLPIGPQPGDRPCVRSAGADRHARTSAARRPPTSPPSSTSCSAPNRTQRSRSPRRTSTIRRTRSTRPAPRVNREG